MKKSTLISIVMPVYNAAKYLIETLDSIVGQDYADWELIAVNDHSTDESKAILQEYVEKDKRIKVLDNNEKGIVTALRLAYKNAQGEYITRMDADDVMPPYKLGEMLQILQQNGRGVVATGKVKYFSETTLGDGYKKYEQWLNSLVDKQAFFSEIYKECVVASPCWMIAREDFELCEAFRPDTYPEDYDLVFRFYQYGMKVIGSEKILHHWRDYGERTSRNDDNYADNRFLDLKVAYFLKLDFDKKKNLVLWGAGKKGKSVAQKLLEKEIDFIWICNNEKKIGKDIYGVRLQGESVVKSIENPQIIVTVAGDDAQTDIMKQLEGLETYFFC